MGHLTCLDVFSFKKTKKHIECCVNEVARKEGDYGTELSKPIRWYEDKIYNSKEEAEKAIRAKDKGWYDQLAVLFREPVGDFRTKKIKDMEKRIERECKKNSLLKEKMHFLNHKSNLITCKNCSSKISSKYLKRTNFCPVCSKDLRPISVQEKIKKNEEKINFLQKELRKMVKKERLKIFQNQKTKTEVFWLVKTEFHV